MNQIFDINKRYEFLYLWDAKDCNPNGDPDDNKPRIDEETGRCYITDVRIKRTIRDYWLNKGQTVFVREHRNEDGKLKTRKELVKEFPDPFECIDNRLFGIVFGAKGKDNKAFTGPLQMKMAKSYNNLIDENGERYFRITCLLPSDEKKGQGTFGEFFVIRYGLFETYGIFNENAAKTTNVKEGDLDHFFEALWKGTKSLITRSKIGQTPRFLLIIEYNENNFHIGDLTEKLKLVSRKKIIENIGDYYLEIDNLVDKIKKYSDKISKIFICLDSELKLKYNGEEIKDLEKLFDNIPFKKLDY